MYAYDINTENFANFTAAPSRANDKYVFETHTLLEAIGDVRNKTVIDLCCGTGRLTWTLLELGAQSVIGLDASREMIARAEAHQRTLPAELAERVRFIQADLCASDLSLGQVDLVTGLYVLHYADTPAALQSMAQFIARHMRTNDTCAVVTLNPDLEPSAALRDAQAETGVYLDMTDGPEATMRVDGFSCPVWHWPGALHKDTLGEAGLTHVQWTGRDVPADRPDLKARFANSIRYPHNVVLTAKKSDAPSAFMHEQMLMMA